jgi:hypothetical protein
LLALEVKDRVPDLSFKSFGAFTAGAAARGTRRRHRTERTATLGWQIWNGRRSRIGDAAISPEALTTYSTRLSWLFAESRACEELWRGDGRR